MKDLGIINITPGEKKALSQKALIVNDEEEMNYIRDLTRQATKSPNEGNQRELHGYILRVEPNWRFNKKEVMGPQILDKIKELFGIDYR